MSKQIKGLFNLSNDNDGTLIHSALILGRVANNV